MTKMKKNSWIPYFHILFFLIYVGQSSPLAIHRGPLLASTIACCWTFDLHHWIMTIAPLPPLFIQKKKKERKIMKEIKKKRKEKEREDLFSLMFLSLGSLTFSLYKFFLSLKFSLFTFSPLSGFSL